MPDKHCGEPPPKTSTALTKALGIAMTLPLIAPVVHFVAHVVLPFFGVHCP